MRSQICLLTIAVIGLSIMAYGYSVGNVEPHLIASNLADAASDANVADEILVKVPEVLQSTNRRHMFVMCSLGGAVAALAIVALVDVLRLGSPERAQMTDRPRLS